MTTRLPLQPLTARAVLGLVGHEAADGELARLVEIDPALSAIVLRLANGPHLGVGRPVGSVRRAVLLLGERTVESLAASGSAAVVFGDADTTAPAGLWAHSVTTAVSSAVLARFTGVPLDDAFTAGVLHDIGALVPAEADEPSGPRATPLDPVAAGAELLRQWGLPPATVRAVRLHRADPATVVEPLGRTVLAGHAVALALRPRPDHRPCLTPGEALAYLGLAGESPDEIMASIQYELDQVVAVLSREAG